MPLTALVAPPAPDRAAVASEQTADEAADDVGESDERFAATLAWSAREAHAQRTQRSILFWSGLAPTLAGLGLMVDGELGKSAWVAETGAYTAEAGALLLAGSAFRYGLTLDDIEATYEAERGLGGSAAIARRKAERAWRALADRERAVRRSYGWLYAVLGTGIAVTFTAYSLHPWGTSPPWPSGDVGPFIGAAVMGAATAGAGAYLLATDGPVASGFEADDRSSGSVALPGRGAALPSVSFVRGGAFVSVGWSF